MMDGEVQPKSGLMVSLILMNLTAVALFFFATPTSREIPKKQVNDTENVPMVMAGDADGKIVVEDKNAVLMPQKIEPLVSPKKTSNADSKSSRFSLAEVQSLNPRFSLTEAQTLHGKVEMRVLTSKPNTPKKTSKMETSDRQTQPPLAVALKNFVGNTSSGVRIFFEGLKNGYSKKRIRESIASNIDSKKIRHVEGISGISQIVPKTNDHAPSLKGSNLHPPSGMKIKEPLASPIQKSPETTPNWIWGPWEDGCSSNHETIPTELVLDVLSRTQKHTNELIDVFSRRVVPAIERMNDKVAEAIRLEKNLDSYTSALINAINSVVFPNDDTDINLKPRHSKPEASAVRKLKNTKAFCSSLSVIRDSRIRDYVGGLSKGERSSTNNRPVFKTLTARCWHTKYKNKAAKKHSRKSKDLPVPGESRELQPSKQDHSSLKLEIVQGFLESTDFETNVDQEIGSITRTRENSMNIPTGSGISKGFTEWPHQRTIGIEEVLTLTSSLEHSSEQGVSSDRDIEPFQSPLNIDSSTSLSSGMACRSCVIKPVELNNVKHNGMEHEPKDKPMILEPTKSPENVASQRSEPPDDPTRQARCQRETGSNFSLVCDSRIQGYDSHLVQKETSTVAAYSGENEETHLAGSSQSNASDSKGTTQQGESNNSVSFTGVKSTKELVNIFKQMDLQQKEIAMENVCLMVLRMFEAWTESQRSISSLGLSRISLSSWPSTDEVSSHCSRPRTAICRSRIDSGQEKKSIMGISLPKDDASKECKVVLNQISSDSSESTEISRHLVQNVVEAAEIQIAERSLMGLRTNLLRNPPSKGDLLKGCIDSADVANLSGFGDIEDAIIGDKELAASLMSKSRESVKVSKESSAATFYTGQPESSEDAFYECLSTMSAGTCGSVELEVKDSSTLFLERIQEEETKVHTNEVSVEAKPAKVEPQAARSSFSIESWLTDSGEELHTARDTLNSQEFPNSDNSSIDVGCGSDDEAYPCSSQDLSADEFKADKNKKDQTKKKKWASKLFKKFLKKKPKPSSFPSVELSKNTSRSQSDSLLKPNDQNSIK